MLHILLRSQYLNRHFSFFILLMILRTGVHVLNFITTISSFQMIYCLPFQLNATGYFKAILPKDQDLHPTIQTLGTSYFVNTSFGTPTADVQTGRASMLLEIIWHYAFPWFWRYCLYSGLPLFHTKEAVV